MKNFYKCKVYIKLLHPLIFKVNENFIESEKLFYLLDKLHQKINLTIKEGFYIIKRNGARMGKLITI